MTNHKPQPLGRLVAAAGRTREYRAALNKLRTGEVRFRNETQFREWIEANHEALGFPKILRSQEACPDLLLEDSRGRQVRVEVEYHPAHFISHRHDPDAVDLVVAVWGRSPLPVPCYVLGKTFARSGRVPVPGKEQVSIYLPSDLVASIKEWAVQDMRSVPDELAALVKAGAEVRRGSQARVATELGELENGQPIPW